VDHVISYLSAWSIHGFSDSFRENHVDGEQLLDLTET